MKNEETIHGKQVGDARCHRADADLYRPTPCKRTGPMLRLAGREVKKRRQLDIIASSEAVVGVRITSIEERRNIYLLQPEPQSGGKIFALLVDINFFDI